MKESTKNIIRAITLIACLLPYRVKKEDDRRTYESLLFEYSWDQKATPSLSVQRNQKYL